MTAEVGGLPRSDGSGEIDTIRALCHDLRQPLAAIRLLAGSGQGDVGRKLEVISDQAHWLAQLVEAVLVDAATDGVGVVDAHAVAVLAVLRAEPTADCSLVVESEADPPVAVWARPVALGRALGCVLDNAVRAAGSGGLVRVRLERSEGRVHIVVADNGPGLGKVSARTSLGLTTTRAMVAACNGTFELRSGPGGGAEADICLNPALRRVGRRDHLGAEPVAS